MRKIITLVVLMILLLPASVLADTQVRVNGNYLQTDTPPIIRNDRVLVPFRAIFEALNASVQWNDTTKTVSAQRDNTSILLQINSKEVSLNNQSKTIDVAPIIHNSRTMVPIRFVSESLGEQVFWDEVNRIAVVGIEKIYKDDGTLLYEGPVVNGKLTGEGKLYEKEKIVYSGNFEDSKPQGRGILYDYSKELPAVPVEIKGENVSQITPDSSNVISNNSNNRLYYEGGSVLYEGELNVNNKAHGKGRLYDIQGNLLYEGEFNIGDMTGEGMLYSEGKIIYKGQYLNNKFNGQGVLYEDGQEIYRGEFKNGDIAEGEK